jgi:hypothetical protein
MKFDTEDMSEHLDRFNASKWRIPFVMCGLAFLVGLGLFIHTSNTVALCHSGLGTFAQSVSQNAATTCTEYNAGRILAIVVMAFGIMATCVCIALAVMTSGAKTKA